MPDAALRGTLLSEVPPDSRLTGGLHVTNIQGPVRSVLIGSGATLAVLAAKERGPVGAALGLAGAAALLVGVTGRIPFREIASGRSPAKQAADAQGWSTAALVHRAVTVNRPRQELYETWRDFSNLARFMENIERIEVRDARTSHWVVKAPLGRTVEWDALVTEDVPGERIAWETAPGADIKSAGWVEFKDGPAGRGTEVRARFAYRPPAGKAGRLAAKLLQREPYMQARRDLRRFKAMMEAGEVPVGHVPGHPATPEDLRI